MSHQATKAGTQSQSVERIMEERQELEDGTEEEVKKAKVRGSQSNIRSTTSRTKLDLANQKKQEGEKARRKTERAKPSTAGPTDSKGESKWMKEVIRQNFVYLVDKLSQQEAKRRVNILRSVRLQLKGSFMKLYRLFRHKKYGEPIEEPEPIVVQAQVP